MLRVSFKQMIPDINGGKDDGEKSAKYIYEMLEKYLKSYLQ